VRIVFLLFAVAIVVASVVTFFKTHPLSDAAYRARVEAAQRASAAAQSQLGAPLGVICQVGPGGKPAPPPGSGPVGSCVSGPTITARDPRFHLTSLHGVFEGVTGPLVILSILIGATVIGAEWPNRTITTILTWEPRRVRVLTAKVASAVVVAAVLTVAGLILLGAALLPAALVHGTTAGTDGAWWRSVGGVLLRAIAMSAIATTIAFSLASIGRNTAAALGVLFGSVIVIEHVVAIFFSGYQRWLIIGNAAVFVTGKVDDAARGQTVAVAGLYLAAVAIGLFAIAGSLFRRRDVA
jgi:hypothetical protein